MHEQPSSNGENTADNGVEQGEPFFPPFNPEQAPELQAEKPATIKAGLVVSEEEAREKGIITDGKFHSLSELSSLSEQWLNEGLASGEITPVENITPEQLLDANAEAFSDIQKRRAFIAQLYPVLTEARKWDDPELAAVPHSIQLEYSLGSGLCHHMLPGNQHGKGGIKYPNGMILPEYYEKSDANDYLLYQEARKTNDQLFDHDALGRFEVPEPDIETAEKHFGTSIEQIRSIKNLEDIYKMWEQLQDESITPPKEIITDIHKASELDKLSTGILYDELQKQEFQIRNETARQELDQAQTAAEQAEEEFQKLYDEFQNTNFIKRALMLATGYQEKITVLGERVHAARSRLEALRARYEHGLGKWDPNSRSFQ